MSAESLRQPPELKARGRTAFLAGVVVLAADLHDATLFLHGS